MAINQFLNFANGVGADIMDQTTYATKAAIGVEPGIADPEFANKTWHQSALMAAALGYLISTDSQGYTGVDALDTVDVSVIAGQFSSYLGAKIDYQISINDTVAHLADNETITGQYTFTSQITATAGLKGNVEGNASTADKLKTARTIATSGDATGSTVFDGSGDATIALTLAASGVAAGSYGPASAMTLDFGGVIQVPQITIDAKGRATAAYNRAITLPAKPTDITGNAGTATKLLNPRQISISGDGTASVTFDGSQNVNLKLTLDGKFVTEEELQAAIGGISFDNVVTLDGTQTITGNKTFSGQLIGNLTGNSATATKLATARTIQVNLASTSTASFDGSANVTPGVTGTLPVANGGTGRTDGKAVAWATARTITLSGAVTGSATMDGSGNVTLNTTLSGGSSGGMVPVGSIVPYMGQGSVPTGYLLCNGSTVSRTTYSALFTAIGTKFGSGNGSTTFTLPNLNGRFLEGTTSTPGTAYSAGLPNITGTYTTVSKIFYDTSTVSGAFSKSSGYRTDSTHGTGMTDCGALNFSASSSNSTYGGSTVRPASYTTQYLIKY